VELFGHLVGDRNPLHSCMTLEEASKFKTWQHAGLLPLATEGPTGTTEALVHGMLVASLFSCIFGSLIPGAIYRSQGLHFRSPIFANDAVLGRIHVTKMKVAHQGLIVTCDTTVIRQERTCVTGEATVWLPEGTQTNEDVV
jgi:acyl dehydratase